MQAGQRAAGGRILLGLGAKRLFSLTENAMFLRMISHTRDIIRIMAPVLR